MRAFPSARRRPLVFLLAGILAVPSAGCHRGQPPAEAPPPPVIPVSYPVRRAVTDYSDYTGRTDAVQSVAIRPRVTGYLTKTPFTEGAEVKAGDLLFEVDPRPYQAMVDQAKSQVTLYQTQAKLAKAIYERDQAANSVPGTVSPQQLEQDKAAVESAQAQIDAAKAVLEAYRLNLNFCTITSPIDGQVSRYYYTVGNLVTQDQTLLTTVVSLDPMYVYFDVDEPTVIRVRNAINEGRMQPAAHPTDIPVLMEVEGEQNYPHHGTLNFINNAVNPSTATMAVRGVFDNPLPSRPGSLALRSAVGVLVDRVTPRGRRLLSPGMFVRVRLPIGQPHEALLVADQAIGSDQGLKFVYVVDAQNTIQYRKVTTGALQEDGLRVVEGIKPDDRVVVGGLLQVRPRMVVEPELTDMPIPATPANGKAPGVTKKPQPPTPGEKTSGQPGNGNPQR